MKNHFCNVLAIAGLLLFGSRAAQAQVDPHFSQTFIQPMTLNPALTGAIDGDYRVSAIWRSQYSNLLQTKGISGEMTTNNNVNLGVNLLNQTTGDKAYSFTNAYLTMAYTGVRFGKDAMHYLTMAIQGGILNRRFDITRMEFGDQWKSGIGYDPSAATGESWRTQNASALDMGAGILYYDASPNKRVNFYGGFSAFHINKPKSPYITADNGEVVPVRYNIHGGARIVVNEQIQVVPNFFHQRQQEARETLVGLYGQLNAGLKTDFVLGANWRIDEAVIPFAGVYYNGFTFGFSYDVPFTPSTLMMSRGNSIEMSLSMVLQRKGNTDTKAFYCPRF